MLIFFLGLGYTLTFTKAPSIDLPAITDIIMSNVAEVDIKENTEEYIKYVVPIHESKEFPKLFRKLEDKKPSLKYQHLRLSVSSLKDVFIK